MHTHTHMHKHYYALNEFKLININTHTNNCKNEKEAK